jgi:bacillithiol synthase
MARSAFTLLEPRAAKLLSRYRLSVAQTFIDQETLEAWIAHQLAPESLMSAFDGTSAATEKAIEKLRTELATFDPTLAAALDKSSAKIQYQLKKTRSKIERELLRRDQRADSDAKYLTNLLYPHKHLQERFYSILPFVAEHGVDLIDRLHEAAAIECADHRVLSI